MKMKIVFKRMKEASLGYLWKCTRESAHKTSLIYYLKKIT